MAIEKVRAYLDEIGLGDRLIEPKHSSGTVEEAALALGCEPKEIAKTIAVYAKDTPLLVVVAGNAKLDNKKFKERFGFKPHMIKPEMVEQVVGHAPGGVCPFAVNTGVEIYLDESLKRFERVYPAGGNAHSAVKLSINELETASKSIAWVNVCKDWE